MSEADDAKTIQDVQAKLRAGQVDEGVRRVLIILQTARRNILADVAGTEWQKAYLSRLLATVDRQLAQARAAALDDVTNLMEQQWKAGAAAVSETADTVGVAVRVPEIPTSLLQTMESKAAQRVTGLFQFAKNQLDGILSQALIGGLSRDEAIAKIGTVLETGTMTDTGAAAKGLFGSVSRRAAFIFQQEMGAAYSTAADLRREQVMRYADEGLKKVWAHDGHPKEPRQGHLLMHGQIREQDEDFENPLTGEELSYPRDPAADISETANCTCSVYLWREEYGDVLDFIGGSRRGPITREDDQYNPGNYVVPGKPVVIGGKP